MKHDASSHSESPFRAVFRVVSGNFLEMYDFTVYAYYASAIARTFFPAENEFVSLLLALSVFGAGFVMRPVGRSCSALTWIAMGAEKGSFCR
ncbi:MFS family permease [Burkholderia sp. 567]